MDGRTNRRKRSWPFVEYEPNAREIRWLQHLAMCGGMLPTGHLHALTADKHKSRDWTTRRLKLLFEAGFLNRDADQEAAVRNDPDTWTPTWHFNKLIHTISPQAIALLQSIDALEARPPATRLWNPYYPNPKIKRSWYSHQIFCNSTRSSFLIDAIKHHAPIWMEHTLLERVQAALRFPFKQRDDVLIPDGLVALEVENTRFLCFLECDRATEPLTSKSTAKKTWQNTLELYQTLFQEGVVEMLDFQAIPLLLNITTSPGRAETMTHMAEAIGFRNVCSLALPQFHPKKFKPQEPIPFLTERWLRSTGKKFSFIRR